MQHNQPSSIDNTSAQPGEIIRVCPCCKQNIKLQRGLSNWKRLFRAPTADDWITLFIIAMIIFAAYAYQSDMAQTRYFLNNFPELCLQYIQGTINQSSQPVPLQYNFTEIYRGVIANATPATG